MRLFSVTISSGLSMQSKAFLVKVLLLICAICLPLNALAFSFDADEGDEDFVAARRAYDKKDITALSANVQQLQGEHYVLAPYADYWLMLLQLDQADNATVAAFLEKYNDYLFADRLRGEWLKALAKRQDWTTFFVELPNFKRDDVAVNCYAADGRWQFNDNLTKDLANLEQAKSLWMVATEQPSNCNQLFDDMQQAGVLTDADIWARFRLALQAGKNTLAKSIVARMPAVGNSANYKLLDRVYANPSLALNKKIVPLKSRYGRELNLYALERLAQTNTAQALSAYKRLESDMPAVDRNYFYGRLAFQASRRLEPEALSWYKKVTANTDDLALDKEQLAWYVRIALRQNDWRSILTAVSLMQPDQQAEAAWRYWKARALKENHQVVEANKLFTELSKERHYYGWLAQDELGDLMSNPPDFYKASDKEIEAIASMPAFIRSEAFQRLEMRWDAKAEWAWGTRNFDDKQMLAAAEYASRKQWHDLAIITADKTTTLHDYELRYPTPYRDLMKASARNQGIDEAWVYGITRQESRFMHYAKSGVGAAGLMQLMPATAKWIAKRAGWDSYNNSMIHDLNTNIQLGTYYLRYTLDLMGGKALMATAAYNAGPSRAKKWLSTQPLEGAVYAETIPFSETRTYVQKVMANANLYAHRLGLKTISLKQRLGYVPAIGRSDNDVNTQEVNNSDNISGGEITSILELPADKPPERVIEKLPDSTAVPSN